MRWCVLAAMFIAACGTASDDAIVVVTVDSTQLVPAPQTLYLTLTDANGAIVDHTTNVAASGSTRIELIVGSTGPREATLDVMAYVERDVVAESSGVAVRFDDGVVHEVSVTLVP